MIPPPLPLHSTYTSCWCEENIYLLCQNFEQNQSLRDSWEIFAVFISNSNKTVCGTTFQVFEPTPNKCPFFFFGGGNIKAALWYQKAAQLEGGPVVWDYHVVLLLRPRKGVDSELNENDRTTSWVYDFDTILPVPCPGEGKFSFGYSLLYGGWWLR